MQTVITEEHQVVRHTSVHLAAWTFSLIGMHFGHGAVKQRAYLLVRTPSATVFVLFMMSSSFSPLPIRSPTVLFLLKSPAAKRKQFTLYDLARRSKTNSSNHMHALC